MAVFALDKHHKPLMPCSEKRARQLLERGRARDTQVDRTVEESIVDGVAITIDPGSNEQTILQLMLFHF